MILYVYLYNIITLDSDRSDKYIHFTMIFVCVCVFCFFLFTQIVVKKFYFQRRRWF